MTIGEDRVRVLFNPSSENIVDQLKQNTAALIDLCEALKANDPRLAALAQTAYERAAMWAAKAADRPYDPHFVEQAQAAYEEAAMWAVKAANRK